MSRRTDGDGDKETTPAWLTFRHEISQIPRKMLIFPFLFLFLSFPFFFFEITIIINPQPETRVAWTFWTSSPPRVSKRRAEKEDFDSRASRILETKPTTVSNGAAEQTAWRRCGCCCSFLFLLWKQLMGCGLSHPPQVQTETRCRNNPPINRQRRGFYATLNESRVHVSLRQRQKQSVGRIPFFYNSCRPNWPMLYTACIALRSTRFRCPPAFSRGNVKLSEHLQQAPLSMLNESVSWRSRTTFHCLTPFVSCQFGQVG